MCQRLRDDRNDAFRHRRHRGSVVTYGKKLSCPYFARKKACVCCHRQAGLGLGVVTTPKMLAVELHHQRNNEQRHDVDDFNQGVDGGARRVFVRIAHGVASHSGFVSL